MLRAHLDALPASRIREVANAAIGREDLLRFWFGESDRPTPAFIRAAAKASLDAGHTFYSHNLGLPELRSAVARYASRLRGATIGDERVCVTSAGVNALALISQALLEPGDRVVIITPVWPNLTAQPHMMGAQVVRVGLRNDAGRWALDLDELLDAARPGTRLVLVNSPNNPTGWVMRQSDWQALLAHCRRHGIWLVSDDAYERLVYDGSTCAPGVLGSVDPDERFISANTFSKTWSMTGWRLGWLIGPRAFVVGMAKLVEFNTSCAPAFVQHAGVAAIDGGEPLIRKTRERLQRARDRLVAQLRQVDSVEAALPDGAMYLFFRVRGAGDDSVALAKRLATEAGLGLAPGAAFGPEGEGCMRWCFAAEIDLLDRGVQRLRAFLGADGSPR